MATDDKTTPAKPATTTKASSARDDATPAIDPRLDNRTGSQRPPLETYPAKPQQIDGPDLMHQAEHTRRALADRDDTDTTPRKGMFSAGPHGLSGEAVREDENTFTGDELGGAKAAG
jgi:hypothetical protein